MASEGPPEPVLVILHPDRGTLSVTGAEAKTWLNGLVSCDVSQVSPGSGAFGLVLNKQGKIQSEVVIVEAGNCLLLGVSPGVAERLAASLNKFLVMEDAELSDVSAEHLWADFHGLGACALATTGLMPQPAASSTRSLSSCSGGIPKMLFLLGTQGTLSFRGCRAGGVLGSPQCLAIVRQLRGDDGPRVGE